MIFRFPHQNLARISFSPRTYYTPSSFVSILSLEKYIVLIQMIKLLIIYSSALSCHRFSLRSKYISLSILLSNNLKIGKQTTPEWGKDFLQKFQTRAPHCPLDGVYRICLTDIETCEGVDESYTSLGYGA
jgi:hypothetical protein